MAATSDKFAEQFHRVQQQFNEWKPFEQLRAFVELSRTLEITYQHFLSQWFQVNIEIENCRMFEHTVDNANSPNIINCLLTEPEKILSTLQLLLPLITMKTMNDKLVHAYHGVFVYLDKNIHLIKYNDFEMDIFKPIQQILFFIKNNIYFKTFLSDMPKLVHIHQMKTLNIDEQQRTTQQIQLDNSNSIGNIQQLTRHEMGDSGVDLTEPTITNSTQIFRSQNPQQIFFDPNFISTIDTQRQHSIVGKTSSSPVTLNVPVRVPLHSAMSAPSPSTNQQFDYRYNSLMATCNNYRSTLAKSDEEEEDENQKQFQSISKDKLMANESTTSLVPFYSLNSGHAKSNCNPSHISPYLGVDQNSTGDKNTSAQPVHPGMKDVRTWLKHLRLHKYEFFFFGLTYNQMLNLTMEQLKLFSITDGACKRILSNIDKLKERSNLLKQYHKCFDGGKIDLNELIDKLEELTFTPICSRQVEIENNIDENLPTLIIELLEKIHKQVISSTSSELCSKFLYLIDRYYRMEAFNEDQVLLLLHWRRYLTQQSKVFALNEHRSMPLLPSHSFQPRRSNRLPNKSMKNAASIHHPNHVLLTKLNSEPQHNNSIFDSSNHRRSNKSPLFIPPTYEETVNNPTHANGTYLANHRHQALSRKQSIDPYMEKNSLARTKLSQRHSDPDRARSQLTSMRHSHQQQQHISTLIVPSISKSHSDNEQYETNAGMDSFCREITDKAINDDVQQSNVNETFDVSMTDQSVANCQDTDQ